MATTSPLVVDSDKNRCRLSMLFEVNRLVAIDPNDNELMLSPK